MADRRDPEHAAGRFAVAGAVGRPMNPRTGEVGSPVIAPTEGPCPMGPTIKIEPLAPWTDPRGLVLEPLGPDELPIQRNAHLTLTEPGCIRGNHYHERGSEVTVVLGPALARYRDGDEVRDFLVPEGQAYRFSIPPGVAHAFRNTGAAPMVLIGFNTEPHDPARPDVVRDVLIEG
jgi:dTDP-4-dehydrorhamnose 3,5-epimerase-like enzyme